MALGFENQEGNIKIMLCVMCKSRGLLEEKLLPFMVDLGGGILVVKNVPTIVCAQCGEKAYIDAVSKQLEQLANTFRDAVAEIAVVNYSEKAA